MSDNNSGMRRQTFQQPNFDPTSQLVYHHQRDGSNGGGSIHSIPTDSPTGPMMNVGSRFNDFNFTYQQMPEPVMVGMPDHSGLKFDNHPVDSFPQHQAINTVGASVSPAQSSSSIIPISGPSLLTTEPDAHRDSVDRSDIATNNDKTSPASISHEDSNIDDCGASNPGRGDGTDMGLKSKEDKDAVPPAWSELKTKAGKDRKRLPLACIACRRKKIRCSGEKPACKHCMRSRIPCVYKVTTRKAAPRTDYMAMLDKRLKRMEERIIKILPKPEQGATSAIPRAVVKPTIPGAGNNTATKPTNRKRNVDEAFGPDLEAWAKAPRPDVPEIDIPGSPDSRDAAENQLLTEGLDALPPKDIQEHLAEVFFDQVYGQAYHLLHKPSYMRKLRNDALPPVLILSVCAISARFTTNPKLNSSAKNFLRGEEWASIARDICTKRYDWPNITILTCLLILGLHEFGTCHGGRSWALGGQAIRMAFALHLHKDLEYDPHARKKGVKLSFIDREIRRRVMWACFLMDRFNSSGTDRPIFIKEATVSIPLPVSERYFQLDMPALTEYLDGTVRNEALSENVLKAPKDNMGIAAYTIRSISIWGRIITYINQGGRDKDAHPMWSPESQYAKLVRENENLLASLPPALQYNKKSLDIHQTENVASHFLFFHMSIQQNLLFLHQAAVSFSRQRFHNDVPKEFIPRSSSKTFLAANKISEFLRDADELQCNIATPFAGYCAFSSTAIHITGIFSGSSSMKATAEANLSVNIKYLRKMMKYWGMFHWMVENIRTQYRNAVDAARNGVRAPGSTEPSPILQYSDWFNRYPHGVSDPDYMDPALYRKKEIGEDAVLEQKSELQSVGDFFEAVGPSNSNEAKDANKGPAPPKRKATAKRVNAGSISKSDQVPVATSPSESGVQGSPGQTSTQQQHQQQQPPAQPQPSKPAQQHPQPPSQPPPTSRFSAQQHTIGFSPSNTMYPEMTPITPENLLQFNQPMAEQSTFFSTDMLSMNLGQPPDRLLQALDRQFSFAGMDDGMNGIMDGFTNWTGGFPSNSGPANSGNNAQAIKSRAMGNQGQLNSPLNQFGGPDVLSGWGISMDGNQGVGLGGNEMDPFGSLFGATNTMPGGNQNSDLQNIL